MTNAERIFYDMFLHQCPPYVNVPRTLCIDKCEKLAKLSGSDGHMRIRVFLLEYAGGYRSEMVHY